MNMTINQWGNVRVPVGVIEEIEKAIAKNKEFKKMGFTNVSSFVNYLIRRELDRYTNS